MIGGIVFVIFGVTTVMRFGGIFGVVWTIIALGIAGGNAYNFFSKKGVATWEVDLDNANATEREGFDMKLRKPNKLKEDGLITEQEFREKREKIMKQD